MKKTSRDTGTASPGIVVSDNIPHSSSQLHNQQQQRPGSYSGSQHSNGGKSPLAAAQLPGHSPATSSVGGASPRSDKTSSSKQDITAASGGITASTPSSVPPLVQSGFDVLSSQHAAKLVSGLGGSGIHGLGAAFGGLPMIDPTNPAFRPGIGLPPSAAAGGYPSPFGGAQASAHASVCKDPYCRDPSCPTAAYNAYLGYIAAASGSSSGGSAAAAAAAFAAYAGGSSPAAQHLPNYLDMLSPYSKLYGGHGAPPPPPLSLHSSLSPHGVAGSLPTSSFSAAAALAAASSTVTASSTISSSSVSSSTAAASGSGVGPHICNWMNGREYCGKRFTTAEELLVHLKTHTNLSISDSGMISAANAAALAAANAPPTSSPFGPGYSQAAAAALLGGAGGSALRSSFPNHLAAAAASHRFSPYAKPGYPLPPSLASLGLPPPGGAADGGLPPHLAPPPHHLSPYLSYLAAANPLSLYGLYGAR